MIGSLYNGYGTILPGDFFPMGATRWDMTPQGTGAMGQKLDAEEVSRQISSWKWKWWRLVFCVFDNPYHPTYGIFTYTWLMLMVNVGKYTWMIWAMEIGVCECMTQ